MDGTTVALFAGAMALGFAAAVGLAALLAPDRDKRLKIEAAKLAVEKVQALNTQRSDEQIDKIYSHVLEKAVAAHVIATSCANSCGSKSYKNDVSSSYIALTAAIMNDLGGLYDLGEGIFQMVLAVRDSLHMEQEVSAPIYSLPVDGESISVFPHNPNRGVEKSRRDSVNHEMKKFITEFHDFWRDETARKSDMKKARISLGLTLRSDGKFKNSILRAMNLEAPRDDSGKIE